MRIVFLGTPRVAVPSLRALAAAHEIPLVISQPDRPAGRVRVPVAPPVKLAAVELGIEVLQPTRLRARAFLDKLGELAPDLLVVVAYGRILRRELLAVAPVGAVNLHFSVLPRYRGAAPVQWALARGEKETGVTTMQISERLDEGDVLQQRTVSIEPGERAAALQSRLAAVGAVLLVETIAALEIGTIDARPQDDAQATYAPLLSVADGTWSPELPAAEIEGRIRGFDPWPGVWARREGRRIRLVDARATSTRRDDPAGTLVDLGSGGTGLVCAGRTVLRLISVQVEGRRTMTAREAANGRQLRIGDRLS